MRPPARALAALAALTVLGIALAGPSPGPGLLPDPLPLAEASRGREFDTRVLASPHFGRAEPLPPFDGHPPKAFDFDGDGVDEAVLQGADGAVYVLDVGTPRLLARLETPDPKDGAHRTVEALAAPADVAAAERLRQLRHQKAGPEAAVLWPGGPASLVTVNAAAVVTVFDFAGRGPDGGFRFVEAWHRRLDGCFPDPSNDARPALADLDGDGRLEIVAQTEEVGTFVLDARGNVVASVCIPGGNADPRLADLDLDGHVDVVLVSDHGLVTALDGRDLATRWSFWAGAAEFNLASASMPVAAAVAQLDGRGSLDVVVGARDAHDASDWSNDHAALFALDGDTGRVLWMRQDPEGAPLTYTRAIAGDLDADGAVDILWADWNNIGHKPPWDEGQAWQRTGPAHVYRYAADGTLVWRATLDAVSNNKDLLLLDVDGDGAPEVLACGRLRGYDGVWALDLATGTAGSFVPVAPWTATRGPIAGDFLGRGTTQWLLPVEHAGQGGVAVHDTGVRE
jgi:hypothetical protein